jgi:hypothetical protein
MSRKTLAKIVPMGGLVNVRPTEIIAKTSKIAMVARTHKSA